MGKDSLLVGWRELAKLPKLNIPLITVKLDTGAKTSALHAHDTRIFKKSGKYFVEFAVHPIQRNNTISVKSIAQIVDMRTVKSSNGQTEKRILIRSPIEIGGVCWEVDITLTNRDIMKHRMLLGRSAMSKLLIDPSHSYLQGKLTKNDIIDFYS